MLKQQTLALEQPVDLASPEAQLQNKHHLCQTEWLAFRITHIVTGASVYRITSNHCNDRACTKCIKYRIATIKARIKSYFDVIEKPKHIVLTVPNMPLNKKNLVWFRTKVRSFYKRLERADMKFFGITTLEIKPAKDGLYNIHIHIIANLSPHHERVTKIWSKIVGQHCSTRVNYRIKRGVALNYFARRCAMAGVGMDASDYLTYVKHTRLFNAFGTWPSYLEVLQTLETEKRKEFIVFPLGNFKRAHNEQKPPDWLTKQFLEQIWLEKT